MKPAEEAQRISASLAVWQVYDPAVKADLWSTALFTDRGVYLVDPIPLEKAALEEFLHDQVLAGTIVTNANHLRSAVELAQIYSVPVFGTARAFEPDPPADFKPVSGGDIIAGDLEVIDLAGAGPGEIALHHRFDGGAVIIGDALINFEPHGFGFLPAKYCENEAQMRQSLHKLLDFDFERLLFAHGTPITAKAKTRLAALLEGR